MPHRPRKWTIKIKNKLQHEPLLSYSCLQQALYFGRFAFARPTRKKKTPAQVISLTWHRNADSSVADQG